MNPVPNGNPVIYKKRTKADGNETWELKFKPRIEYDQTPGEGGIDYNLPATTVDALGEYTYELIYYPDPKTAAIKKTLYTLKFRVAPPTKYILYVGTNSYSTINFCRVLKERYDSEHC